METKFFLAVTAASITRGWYVYGIRLGMGGGGGVVTRRRGLMCARGPAGEEGDAADDTPDDEVVLLDGLEQRLAVLDVEGHGRRAHAAAGELLGLLQRAAR